MTKLSAIAFVSALALTAFLPAPGTATAGTIYYLHALAPAGNVDELADWGPAVAGTPSTGIAPSMDANAPTLPAPKVTQTSSGNDNYARNVLLGYWSGAVHGNLTDITADLWVVSSTGGNVEVTLFADQPLESGAFAARASAAVPAGGPTHVSIAIPTTGVNVDRALVLSVYAGTQGVAVLYDAGAAPSSLSFTVGAYVPPPPPASNDPAWTPATGWGPVTKVNLTLTARETSLVIDPTNDNNMFLCAPSGVPNTPYGQSYFYKSTDAGATWSYVRVETDATDLREYTFEGGDCDVAYDAAGTMYTADTWLGDLSVGHSSDGGAHWAGTPLAVTSPIVDRPWLVGGPAGTVHITYQDVQFGMPTAIWYTRSTDGGVTFRPAVPVATASTADPFSWEGNFVVSKDQNDIYQVFTRRANGVVGVSGAAEQVWIASSHDGGLTWSTKQIASTPKSASYLYPSIAMDAAGDLHVVYASATSTDQPVWYQFSSDGTHWSSPLALQHGVAGYAPWVAGAGAGSAVVEWLGTPTTVNSTSTPADWFFYVAHVTGADTGTPTVTSGTTTTTPVFHGKQSATPEFNEVRLDSQGKARLGMSVFYTGSSGDNWAEIYQAGP